MAVWISSSWLTGSIWLILFRRFIWKINQTSCDYQPTLLITTPLSIPNEKCNLFLLSSLVDICLFLIFYHFFTWWTLFVVAAIGWLVVSPKSFLTINRRSLGISRSDQKFRFWAKLDSHPSWKRPVTRWTTSHRTTQTTCRWPALTHLLCANTLDNFYQFHFLF